MSNPDPPSLILACITFTVINNNIIIRAEYCYFLYTVCFAFEILDLKKKKE